jgi:dTMP kinase
MVKKTDRKKGLFIVFEGIEGCGKSTQIKLLESALRNHKDIKELVITHEPGGTLMGQKIRKLLLSSEGAQLDPYAELFLFEASRAQNISENIRPALERGALVLCDRFTDSTLVYQGMARGLDLQAIYRLNQVATHGLEPDLVVLLDLDVSTSLQRSKKRLEDSALDEGRFEGESLEFHQKVRDGFLQRAKEDNRIHIIDADRSPDRIGEDILNRVDKFLIDREI